VKGADSTLPRKTSKENRREPYLKPTQVDEENIQRRSREGLLRNSANWTRNFGRRVAPVACKREGAAVKRVRRLFNKNTGLCKVENDGRLKGEVSRKAKL
jgi:hypothetical protein